MATSRSAKKHDRKFAISRECVEAWIAGDDVRLAQVPGLNAGQYPPAIHPDQPDIGPEGCAGSPWHPHGQELWRKLDEARKAFRIRRLPPEGMIVD